MNPILADKSLALCRAIEAVGCSPLLTQCSELAADLRKEILAAKPVPARCDTVTVCGHSDDLVEVEGAIREEFCKLDDEPLCLAFSDGTVLSVRYDMYGCWRIHALARGSARYEKTEAEGANTDNYTDLVTLTGDLRWVMAGSQFVVRKES